MRNGTIGAALPRLDHDERDEQHGRGDEQPIVRPVAQPTSGAFEIA